MMDLSYIEDLEKRTTLLQEMFEEDSDAYKEFMSVISVFKTHYENFEERVRKLEDTVFTLVRMMKQRSDRDGNFLDALENAIRTDTCLRDDYTPHSSRVNPEYDQASCGNSFSGY